MLAQSVMIVVFVQNEIINSGSLADGRKIPKAYVKVNFYKCATETDSIGNDVDGTGKPHKRETQIMVGESISAKRSDL